MIKEPLEEGEKDGRVAATIRRATRTEANEEHQNDEEVERALDVELGPLISDIAKTFKHSKGHIKSKSDVMKEWKMQAILNEKATRDLRKLVWNQCQESARQNDIVSCTLEGAFQRNSWDNTLSRKELNK